MYNISIIYYKIILISIRWTALLLVKNKIVLLKYQALKKNTMSFTYLILSFDMFDPLRLTKTIDWLTYGLSQSIDIILTSKDNLFTAFVLRETAHNKFKTLQHTHERQFIACEESQLQASFDKIPTFKR